LTEVEDTDDLLGSIDHIIPAIFVVEQPSSTPATFSNTYFNGQAVKATKEMLIGDGGGLSSFSLFEPGRNGKEATVTVKGVEEYFDGF
jgi:hypothetical protein